MRLAWAPVLLAAACLAVLAAPPELRADITWQVHQTIEVAGAPIDMQVSSRGNWIFVLDDKGELLIYSSNGQYKDKIPVGTDVDQIKSGPRDNIVFLLSRKKHNLQLISFAIKESIDIQGSPFKGPESAPVTIAVFSDFQ